MATYRGRLYEEDDGFEYYSIEKRVLFFWITINWWHANPKGRTKYVEALDKLEKNGHIVF